MLSLSEKQMPVCILGRWYLKVWFSGISVFTQKIWPTRAATANFKQKNVNYADFINIP